MPAAKNSWQWYCLPAALFLIGFVSIIMLFGVDRIRESQRVNHLLQTSILRIQIQAMTFHLEIDEFIGGDATADVTGAVAAVDKALALADGILKGAADPEQGLFTEPMQSPGLRAGLEELKTLLAKFRLTGLALVQPRTTASQADADHLLHDNSKEILEKAAALERVIETDFSENRRKLRRLFLSILGAWTAVMTVATAGLWSLEMRRKRAEESLLLANGQLLVQAAELTEHRRNLAELVEKRTAELSTANELLRHLSSRLLDAQEIERRRISMELHDELGQALNVSKIRIRTIEKGLRKDQSAMREDCLQLLEYMDYIIEDVRRLSLDLSPTVLEELGLTAALRWLTGNFAKIPATRVAANIEEINHLFQRNRWITIYRVVQEALTNIGKHAQAGNISVSVGGRDDRVVFSIADDGLGFNPERALAKEATERGRGLATMNERVGMMGGVLELRSAEGEGTRITFTIPVDKGDV